MVKQRSEEKEKNKSKESKLSICCTSHSRAGKHIFRECWNIFFVAKRDFVHCYLYKEVYLQEVLQ